MAADTQHRQGAGDDWLDARVLGGLAEFQGAEQVGAVGHADGPRAGLAALAELDDSLPRHSAVAAHLHEMDGNLSGAARLYAEAATRATNVAERDHLTRQAARLNTGTR